MAGYASVVKQLHMPRISKDKQHELASRVQELRKKEENGRNDRPHQSAIVDVRAWRQNALLKARSASEVAGSIERDEVHKYKTPKV